MRLKQTKKSINKFKNPFSVEDYRNNLAEKRNIRLFKKTYVSISPEINNLNSGKFWNKIFKNNSTFKDQDSMTKEKINTAISFLPAVHSKILDLGIGQGYLEERLKERKLEYKIYGIDISSTSIKRAKRMFKGEFKLGDVMQINKHYKPNSFDAIVALELIEHIPPSKVFPLYSKVKNLLRENGSFIITTPLNEGLRYMTQNPSGHVREYTIPILKTELSLSGFTIREMKVFYAFKTMYLFKNLLARIIKNKWQPNNIAILCVKN